MTSTTAQQSSHDGGTELPRPRRGARWRWSRPRHALVAGGALAAVLSLGVAAGSEAGAATAPGGTGGRPPGAGMTRPTASGKITALHGDDITLQTDAKSSVTVVYSSSTTFETDPGPGGGTTSSASALKVGDFVGVQGTKESNGTVTASSVTIGRPRHMGKGGPGGGSGAGRAGKPPSGAPSA
jgi:hypothetical protein